MHDKELGKKVFDQFMEMFIIPEIEKRQSEGIIEKPYPLNKAQILFYPDGKKPEVRLNDEVRAISKVKVNCVVQKGDPVYWDQIDSIEEIILEDDLDCGHATMLSVNGSWHIAFDFIYNKDRSRKHLNAAKEFLEGAKMALENSLWSLFVESLCAASELSSKAYLLGMPDQQVMNSKTHGIIKSKINVHGKLGNVQESHVSAFNKLWGHRNYARYLEGELSLTEDEASDLVDNIEEFINYVESKCQKKL